MSRSSSGSKIRQVLSMRAMRRQPSRLALELQEEKLRFTDCEMPMEPRPADEAMIVVGGIFEVLNGSI